MFQDAAISAVVFYECFSQEGMFLTEMNTGTAQENESYSSNYREQIAVDTHSF